MERFEDIIDEPCGATIEIPGADIVEFGKPVPARTCPDLEWTCCLPWGHLPWDRHSDGINQWIGGER